MNVKNQGEDIMKISLIQMELNGNKREDTIPEKNY